MANESLIRLSSRERKLPGLRVERVTETDAWGFYNEHPEARTPFNRPDVVESIAQMYGWPQLRLGLYGRDGLEGVAAFPIQRKGPLGNAQSLPIRYAGLMSTADKIPAHLITLSNALARRGIGRMYASFGPGVTLDLEELQEAGIDFEEQQTCVLPLTGELINGIPATIGSRMRESVRKVHSEGLVIRPSTAQEMEEVLPRLLDITYQRTGGVRPYPEQMGKVWWERHRNDPSFHMKTALAGDKVIGMLTAITDPEKRAFSLNFAKDYENPEAERLNVNGALIVDMAIDAKNSGITDYDLGGGTQGIVEYKRRMGAKVQSNLAVQLTHPLYKRAFDLWEKYKPR